MREPHVAVIATDISDARTWAWLNSDALAGCVLHIMNERTALMRTRGAVLDRAYLVQGARREEFIDLRARPMLEQALAIALMARGGTVTSVAQRDRIEPVIPATCQRDGCAAPATVMVTNTAGTTVATTAACPTDAPMFVGAATRSIDAIPRRTR